MGKHQRHHAIHGETGFGVVVEIAAICTYTYVEIIGAVLTRHKKTSIDMGKRRFADCGGGHQPVQHQERFFAGTGGVGPEKTTRHSRNDTQLIRLFDVPIVGVCGQARIGVGHWGSIVDGKLINVPGLYQHLQHIASGDGIARIEFRPVAVECRATVLIIEVGKHLGKFEIRGIGCVGCL